MISDSKTQAIKYFKNGTITLGLHLILLPSGQGVTKGSQSALGVFLKKAFETKLGLFAISALSFCDLSKFFF